MDEAPEGGQMKEQTVEQMKLSQVVTESKRLGIWTYTATASAKGVPYVTPYILVGRARRFGP